MQYELEALIPLFIGFFLFFNPLFLWNDSYASATTKTLKTRHSYTNSTSSATFPLLLKSTSWLKPLPWRSLEHTTRVFPEKTVENLLTSPRTKDYRQILQGGVPIASAKLKKKKKLRFNKKRVTFTRKKWHHLHVHLLLPSQPHVLLKTWR